ncbi:MAG: hypothetical protein DRP01_07540, partial [Archaeoglobales archaeon]
YRLTTPLLDLGGTFQDYAWFADYMLWDRMEHDAITRENTVAVYFSEKTYRAPLSYRSDMNKATASLYFEAVEGRREVSPANWRFVDAYTVVVDSSQYIAGIQYFLTHYEERMYPRSSLTVLMEHRSGVDSPSCQAASWVTVQRNENVSVNQSPAGHVIHQLRLSVSSIRDLRDFRMRSLVLKGLHLHGASPFVQGITNV